MRFDELALYMAIHDVTREIENPGSDEWLIDEKKKEELCRKIQEKLSFEERRRWAQEAVLKAWTTFRKSGERGRTAIQVARKFGHHCFFKDRGVGECSDELQVDHIVPISQGGPDNLENMMIVCSFHNRQKAGRGITEYLQQAWAKRTS